MRSVLGLSAAVKAGGLALICTALSDKCGCNNSTYTKHVPYGLRGDQLTSSLTEIGPLLLQYPSFTEQVFTTLSYFDLLNLAHLIRTPLLVSVGLKDTVCLPETIFAVYNRIAPEQKSILIDPFAGHEVSRANNREGLRFMQNNLF